MAQFLLDFAANHPFLFWCALWLAWLPLLLPFAALNVTFRLVNRLLRTIKVACRGWPPEHLDADGNFRELPKLEEAPSADQAR